MERVLNHYQRNGAGYPLSEEKPQGTSIMSVYSEGDSSKMVLRSVATGGAAGLLYGGISAMLMDEVMVKEGLLLSLKHTSKVILRHTVTFSLCGLAYGTARSITYSPNESNHSIGVATGASLGTLALISKPCGYRMVGFATMGYFLGRCLNYFDSFNTTFTPTYMNK